MNNQKFICIHSNSGNVYALQVGMEFHSDFKEVLRDEKVMSKLNDAKFAEEVFLSLLSHSQIAVLEEFKGRFRTDPDYVSYGEKSVTNCIEQGAVETLLVSDLLIRGKAAPIRKRIVESIHTIHVDWFDGRCAGCWREDVSV